MSVAPLQLLKSEFNPLVYVALDNATDKFVSLAYYYGATTTTPSDAYFTKGALLVHATDGTTYQNTAADGATPTWGILGGGGGGIAIGDAITDADAASILYVDASGNLTQDANFTRDSSGNTLIRAQDVGIQNGTISVQTGLAAISATDETNSSFTRFRTTPTIASGVYYDGISLQNGFNINSNGITLGNLSGGNNTKITVDDVTQLVTISNVPTYADETTAIGAGLTTGQVYKSYDGQNYFLAIVH